ncbi:cupin domain-containing protein [Microbacterium sp. LWH7-1.2]|uniref:cupin domain-containing protein n=1 Tax=Microbacterium sp. LWH7-1.2 TaxID=3135257 RepID=UPI0031386DB4
MSTQKGDAAKFTGDVWVDLIAPPEAGISAGIVRFAPNARTAWHSHALGQTLHVTDGIAIVHIEGENPVLVTAGTTHFTPAGVRHWHGATPDRFMAHVAIAAMAPDEATVDWQERVDDNAYLASVELGRAAEYPPARD